MTDKQTYTGCNHVRAPGLCISLANPSLRLIDTGGRWWLFEWHHYFGPMALHKRTHDPVRTVPPQRFYDLAQLWHDQGCKVINGVAQWSEPVKVLKRYKKIGRNCFEVAEGEKVEPPFTEVWL